MQTKWLPLALGLTLAIGLTEVKAQEPKTLADLTKDVASLEKKLDDLAVQQGKILDVLQKLNKRSDPKAGEPAPLRVPEVDDEKVTAKKIDDSLLQAVNHGTVLYQFGQHDQAAYIYHVALINALAALDKIKADELKLTDPELRNLKFRVVRAIATPAKDAAWRAVTLRTAINDIRNVKLRHPDKGSPKDTLVERMGGQIALALIYRDAMGVASTPGRPAADCATPLPFYLNPYFQLFGTGTDGNRPALPPFNIYPGYGNPLLGSGAAGLPFGGLSPYGFGGLSPYGFGMPFGNTTQLQTALRNYCVPEPEANEFIARMMGLDLDGDKK